jgi:DNA gyrase subunit A
MFPLQEGEKINVVLASWRADLPSQPARLWRPRWARSRRPPSTSSATRAGRHIAVDLDRALLIGAALTGNAHDVMLFSDGGKAVRFDETTSDRYRNARGVRMTLEDGWYRHAGGRGQEQSVLTATENGYGKRTSITSTRDMAGEPRA